MTDRFAVDSPTWLVVVPCAFEAIPIALKHTAPATATIVTSPSSRLRSACTFHHAT
ncbi:hypothetical protein ABTY98_21310 [Streptomyces sp. NPDC096040]|uniref:hypothetical protein n=1 Tax=Streptomyces sp. NPDC096040 TaxID=3155541 RepID=UPI0033312FAA